MEKKGDYPLITIVTVVYNNKFLLEKTIKSVLEQSFQSYEYLVIDGGSTDGSLEVINKYEHGIAKWISEKDHGIYHAMNKSIDLAKGKWICFLNSGDVFIDAQTLELVVENIVKNKDADILYGNICVETKNGLIKERIAEEPCNKHRMYFCHQSAFVIKELLQRFHFDENYKMSADLKFFKECYNAAYKFVHMHFPVVIYDRKGVSNTNREAGLLDNIAVIKEVDKGLEKYLFLFRLYFVIFWRKLKL